MRRLEYWFKRAKYWLIRKLGGIPALDLVGPPLFRRDERKVVHLSAEVSLHKEDLISNQGFLSDESIKYSLASKLGKSLADGLFDSGLVTLSVRDDFTGDRIYRVGVSIIEPPKTDNLVVSLFDH